MKGRDEYGYAFGNGRRAAAPALAEIVVTLRDRRGRKTISVDAQARPGVEAFALGKAPEEAARLSGLIYNLCAAAQEGAARAALGLPLDPALSQRIALEALRDHVLMMTQRWPRALGFEPDRAALAALPGAADDVAALSHALFGEDGPPRGVDLFEAWVKRGETVAARCMGHVWSRWDSRWARAALPLWRIGDAVHDIDFIAAEMDAAPVDVSLAARVADHALMREIGTRRGRGLPWRMAARVVDAARLLDGLPLGSPDERPECLAEGLGAANAGRGALLVRAESRRGKVSKFMRLTPTDFALHPKGALARAVEAIPMKKGAPLDALLDMTLLSIDPCMPFRLVREG